MGLKDRLDGKSAGLGEGTTPAPEVRAEAARPARTGPGALFGLREEMQRNEEELGQLRDLKERLEAGKPVVSLDPKRIRWSKFANRLPQSFDSPEYARLLEDIRTNEEGNVQPIKVRPVSGDPDHDYEIIFGHRRHRACQDAGKPVNAIVVELGDVALFIAMDEENRDREDLSPYEAAVHYRRALNEGLWPSINQMATEMHVNQSHISALLALADLPREILAAFPNPLELQVRWGRVLAHRLAEDRSGVLKIAERLSEEKGRHTSNAVFVALAGGAGNVESRGIVVKGKQLATLKRRGEQVSVAFARGAVPRLKLKALQEVIKGFLQDHSEG